MLELRRWASSEGFEVERNKLKLPSPENASEPKEETALGE
jgi:hypothetical protein